MADQMLDIDEPVVSDDSGDTASQGVQALHRYMPARDTMAQNDVCDWDELE